LTRHDSAAPDIIRKGQSSCFDRTNSLPQLLTAIKRQHERAVNLKEIIELMQQNCNASCMRKQASRQLSGTLL
jgi:hypothetical protein